MVIIYPIVFKLQGKNHQTMKYRSQWPTFILRSNVLSYWLIIPKYDVHTSYSLQDIRQYHWTVKYRSSWPSFHDPQVHVTRLSHVWQTISISCFNNRKVQKNTFKRCPIFWSLAPPWGMDPTVRSHGMKADPPGVPMVQIWMLSDEWLVRYAPLEKL